MMSTPETASRLVSGRPPGARERRPTIVAARNVANDGYWEWNLATSAVEYSPRCREMLGITEPFVLSHPSAWLDRVHPNDRDAVRAVIQRLSSGEQTRAQCEHRVQHADGSYRWLMARAATVCDSQGLPNRVVGWLSDVTDRKTLERQYAGSARHDTMTGLPNRVLLTDRLTDALEICKRGESGFALLVVDLNNFHRINSRFGDVGGDDVLRSVAQVLRQSVRIEDVVARIGGDKFGILILGDELQSVAGGIATRIKTALRRPYRLNDEEIFISATIGVVIGQSSYARAGEVLRDADSALDEGKRLGGDRVLVFQPAMHHAPAARLGRERDIRLAMERGEFALHFQPMLGAPNGDVTAFEALLRWQHPTEGLLGPSHFLDVLRETGLIIPVGRRVIRDACTAAARWQQEGRARVSVSVNVATSQLAYQGFVADVEQALFESGLEPASLMLEVTEEALVGDADSTRAVLQRLRACGVRVFVDDFGTGYSSLSHLRELPVHGVKIDRGFLDGIHLPGAQREIVRTIVRLAHLLNLDVVAEGVETEAQMDVIRDLQCDIAQGFWIARPLDPDAAEAFLRDRRATIEIA